MIALGQTRATLLAEIGAADSANEPLRDILDRRNSATAACVRVSGNGRDNLFPILKVALAERFAAVPRPQILQDLLVPLRNALGNAFKHGNGEDPAKAIAVEIILAARGALIAITDEGAGFDAALTFQRFQGRETYFERHGCGFRNLHQARSTVSYENGGRTFLLCFRPTMPDQEHVSSSPASGYPTIDRGESSGGHGPHESGGSRHEKAHSSLALSQSVPTSAATRPNKFAGQAHGLEFAEALPKALDADWIKTSLSAELPEFASGQARLESCRVYETRGPAGDDCGNRYVLRVAAGETQQAKTWILTGRLHATEAAAQADFEAATQLHETKISKRVLVPRPVARLAGEPHLVLYDFDPWVNLWEYLTQRRSIKSLRHSAERIAQVLAGIHRSQVALGDAESDPVGVEFGAMARAETVLQSVRGGAELVNRFRALVQRAQERTAFRRHTLAPIHGSFGWGCIHYGVYGHFHLSRFENCRRSDPGLDLGGFAADLLCFTLANHNEEVYRLCRDIFLNHYNANAEHPLDVDDLRFYLADGLIERLHRADAHASLAQWLDALEAAVGSPHRSELSSASS